MSEHGAFQAEKLFSIYFFKDCIRQISLDVSPVGTDHLPIYIYFQFYFTFLA